MNSKFATYRAEVLGELLRKDVNKISDVCGVSASEAEIKLVARLVGRDKFYESLSRSLAISASNDEAFNHIQSIKGMIFEAIRDAYLIKASEMAEERLKGNP